MRKLYWLMLLAAGMAAACRDEEPMTPSDEFYVRITVRDSQDRPVPNLRVSVWNELSVVRNPLAKAEAAHFVQRAVTTFQFGVELASPVRFAIFDLKNRPIKTLFDGRAQAGIYALLWDGRNELGAPAPSGVYKAHYSAKDSVANTLLFQDSIYAVLYQPDPEISVLGWTSAQGVFETTETLWFPNLFDLPDLILTREDGPDPLAVFSILDSVTIVLTDTSTQRQQTFHKTVVQGLNDLQLRWNPAGTNAKSHTRRFADDLPLLRKPIRVENEPALIPPEWFLTQNYPNPFN